LQKKGKKTWFTAYGKKMKKLQTRFIDIKAKNFKSRLAALLSAGLLGAFSLVLTLSLIGSVFDIKAINPLFGSFFSNTYGILAFFIPAFFGYAAFLLADPRWKPERLYILGVSLFPFLTLGIGFIITRDFEFFSINSSFLSVIGKIGFGFFIVFITLLELVFLRLLWNRLFPLININGKKKRIWRSKKGPMLLPPPKPNLKQVYTDAASGYIRMTKPADNEENESDQIDDENDDDGINDEINDENENNDTAETIELHLPPMRPLHTPLAIEYLGDKKKHSNENYSRKPGSLTNSVERALEEAEIIAAIHSEKIRKKFSDAHFSHSKKRNYSVPLEILNQYPDGEYWVIDQATRDAALILKGTLEEFKIQAEVTGIRKGPVITMFEILPAPGVKLSRIVNLQDNIALRLAASSVRIVAPIPGKHAVGIEVPNARRNIVSFREIIEGELQREGKKPEIPVVMGKNISGEALTIDLTQTPHLLIAGATGAGKSVCVNSIILSILYQLSPSECRLILIDPKIVELKLYNDIPHLLTPVITEPKRAFQALQYCIFEMERRYACLDKMGVRDIRNYNKRIRERNIAQEALPYMVIIIDEFADLMATTGKELESTVARLASMSRAVGIHLVLATQRPSIDVITGLIKANIPSRIAFMVASKIDSRIIIDMVGAEKLLGKGDMLYSGVVDPFPIRMQGAFVSEEEVEAVVDHVKTLGEPDYIDDEIFFDDDDDTGPSLFSDGEDPLYEKALEIVFQQGKASASFIQRRLKIGYNRAARLVEEMEQRGVVGPAQGSKPRELLRGM